jgi:hypothetical protein
MTDKTGIYSARVPKEVIEGLKGLDRRQAIEGLARLLSNGSVVVRNGRLEVEANCNGCPYVENDLNMDKFDEVCGIKGIDRQKALDMCVQMMWR